MIAGCTILAQVKFKRKPGSSLSLNQASIVHPALKVTNCFWIIRNNELSFSELLLWFQELATLQYLGLLSV